MEDELVEGLFGIVYLRWSKLKDAEIGATELNHASRMQPYAAIFVVRFQHNYMCLWVCCLVESAGRPLACRLQVECQQVEDAYSALFDECLNQPDGVSQIV